mgnify:FL=1
MRIYTGADVTFTLYEDEGNNYNYENGAYNEIICRWNDKTRVLTIGDSNGNFSGFQKDKVFNITVIYPLEDSDRQTESMKKVVQYSGQKLNVNFDL